MKDLIISQCFGMSSLSIVCTVYVIGIIIIGVMLAQRWALKQLVKLMQSYQLLEYLQGNQMRYRRNM